MKYLKYLLLLIAALSCAPGFSEDLTKSVLAPRRTGQLAIAIVASDKPDYIKDLLTGSAERQFEITKLKTAYPGQSIYTSFLVTGVYLNLNEEYDYKVSFYVKGPDGKAIFGQRNFASGHGKHPKKPAMYLADPPFELIFGPEHPKGKYRIVARVEDQTNGQTAKNHYDILLQDREDRIPSRPGPANRKKPD